jgi:hypothetical protein
MLSGRAALERDYDLLANACGLASSLDWDYYPPREVPPMTDLPRQRPPIDPDDNYPPLRRLHAHLLPFAARDIRRMTGYSFRGLS